MICIYCQRSKEQHTNDGQVELIGDSGRCCPGFTSRGDLAVPNFITYGIGSECLKDMLFSMERAIEMLVQMGLGHEAQEIEIMRRRIEEMQANAYNKAVTTLEEANARSS